ncbi:MAG: glycosyltransferase family 2 protein [Cyanobacteria bacterium P01_D01_bin.1]
MEESVLAIIPALNESETIAGVILGLQEQGITQICVVDNGSRDRTQTIAAQSGASVVTEPRQGYGQACWSGLQTPAAKRVEWILFCDGDGSDDLSQLGELLALRPDYDLILGNRRENAFGRSRLTPVQNFGNWLATQLIWLGWGRKYEDLGPLRLIRRTAIDRLNMADRGFGWTVEMQAKAVEHGLRICELPVNYLPRQGGRSKISGTVVGSARAGQVILSTLAGLYGQRLMKVSRQQRFQQGLLWAIALLMILGSAIATPHGDFLNQPDAVPLFWRGMGLMSIGFVLSWGLNNISSGWFWLLAILPRLVMLAMYPGDDIWRYLWEGHIQNLGFNPYLLPPSADVLVPFRFDWWGEINHPDLAAVYPPIAQLWFRLLAAITPSVLLFKSTFVAADLGICWLLSRRFGRLATLIYAWNPLVIYSFAGGGHYDSLFLLPLVTAWLLSPADQRARRGIACNAPTAIGVSIAVKWMSLPVLALIVWQTITRRKWGRGLLFLLLGLLPLAIATLPFCEGSLFEGVTCPVVPLSSPFVNYGRSASLIPQLVSDLWPASVRANWIYTPPLAGIVLWGLVRSLPVGKFTELYFIALMLLSPVIHAWYFTWLVPFAVASRNWGTRLVSLSAFVYFALPYGLATGSQGWMLSGVQRWALWGPFVLGLAISLWSRGTPDQNAVKTSSA